MREITVSYNTYKNDKILSRCKKVAYDPETKTAALELTEVQYLALGIVNTIPQEEYERWVEDAYPDRAFAMASAIYEAATYYAQTYLDGDIDRDALCNAPVWVQQIVAAMDRETGRTEDMVEAMEAIDAARIAANKIAPTAKEAAHYAELKQAYDTLKAYHTALRKQRTICPTNPFLKNSYDRMPNLADLDMDQIKAAYHLGKQLAQKA